MISTIYKMKHLCLWDLGKGTPLALTLSGLNPLALDRVLYPPLYGVMKNSSSTSCHPPVSSISSDFSLRRLRRHWKNVAQELDRHYLAYVLDGYDQFIIYFTQQASSSSIQRPLTNWIGTIIESREALFFQRPVVLECSSSSPDINYFKDLLVDGFRRSPNLDKESFADFQQRIDEKVAISGSENKD